MLTSEARCVLICSQHAEEMRLIIEALEREGFGPTQATADEVRVLFVLYSRGFICDLEAQYCQE